MFLTIARRDYTAMLLTAMAMFLLCCVPCEAQGIPDGLKASLDSRLQQFVHAQAEDRWNDVAELLGRYRRTGSQQLYTAEHKQCLLTQMRSAPMVAFTVEQVAFSSELHFLPAGQEKWWYLYGPATFKTPADESRERSEVIAYRDQQEWYFTPPNYDDRWDRAHVKDEDFTVDRRDELEILTAPDSPVELVDLHVYMDKKYFSLRDLQFRVRNKTDKRTFGYSLYLGRADEKGSILSGGPLRLEPEETSRVIHLSYSAYSFSCEKREKHLLELDGIDFVDGAEWKSPRKNKHWGSGDDGSNSPGR